MLEGIKMYMDELIDLLNRVPRFPIQDVISILAHARFNNKQVIIMGNGGSAATASHFACDLGKGTLMPNLPRFRVIALTDNMPLFSALANDYGYDYVFSEQLQSLIQPGDVVIGISGSGNSPNVLNAIKSARQAKAITIGLIGFDGGLVKDLVDVYIHVPSNHMEQVEDVHLILEHLICTCVRQIIEGSEHKVPETIAAEQWAWRLSQFPMMGNGANGESSGEPNLEAIFPAEPSLADEAEALARGRNRGFWG
jgi:D-sedoheptulose 7-phosphate isomerase